MIGCQVTRWLLGSMQPLSLLMPWTGPAYECPVAEPMTSRKAGEACESTRQQQGKPGTAKQQQMIPANGCKSAARVGNASSGCKALRRCLPVYGGLGGTGGDINFPSASEYCVLASFGLSRFQVHVVGLRTSQKTHEESAVSCG